MGCSFLRSVAAVPAPAWNHLAGCQPFLRHEFLTALEESGSVGPGTGWQPQPLVVTHGDRITAVVPFYRKTHSYGEYVFDWAWAAAYQRAGLPYYPKLVAAVPFTPVTGPRILAATEARAALVPTIVDAVRRHSHETGISSVHWLFTDPSDTDALERHGFLRRTGYQFHWTNQGWGHFDHYLGALSSAKRKNIRRERRQVAAAGVRYHFYEGQELTEARWDDFYALYHATIDKYGAIPYLTRRFFSLIGERLPGSVLVMAEQAGTVVAGALFFRDNDTLFGRYWGTVAPLPGLHFETCYYQAIEYCLAQGLMRFEAGAQGEHKLSRGFLPVATYSAHWLSHPQFNRAVEDFLVRENAGLEYYLHELNDHSPFHRMP
ncbi:MAG: GNAT family N-acetyltransferase [Acidiferrobacter sp.]